MRAYFAWTSQRRRRWTRPRRWLPRAFCQLDLWWVDKVVELVYVPHVGYVARRWRYRDVPGGQWWEYLVPEVRVKKKSPSAAPAPGDGPKHIAPMESNVFHKLHNIVAHCAITRYDDGDPRRPGWITVQTLGSAWKVMVKDPDGCCQMSAIGNTLDDALALADLLLGSEDAPWEPDPFLKRQESGKKK